jgi:hypothetical protein
LLDVSWQDAVNGAFEMVGGFVLWANVWKIKKDKMVRGALSLVTLFFTLWGYWNLYYYPSLNQWLSFFGGINIVAANSAWFYYMNKYRKN